MEALFLRALKGRNDSSRPPVWLMRQAGRHLASYRAIRQRFSFLEMCHQPDLIAQVTMLPIEAYEMDAAILFSDILLIPEAMGVGLHFEEQVGPRIERPLCTPADIEALPWPHELSHFRGVEQGIRALRRELKVPLIGFCGAPFTLASYLIEGKTGKEFKKTKHWLLNHPGSFHDLLEKLAAWCVAYLNLQIQAGVQAIQIFDSWANVLAYSQFREFSLFYLKKILEGIAQTGIPGLLFCRGSSVFASQLAEIKPAGVSLDWNCYLPDMRQKVPASISLQGNLDPHLLYAPLSKIKEEVRSLLEGMRGDRGYIFNLGHGLPPDVPEEAVRTLVECVKCHSIL